MPICIPHLGLAIYTSPKVMSTSLKFLAFRLENGREFQEFSIAGRRVYVHRFYPAWAFEEVNRDQYPHVVAFVRDPLERFLSMYRNRVLRKHDQSHHLWRKAIQAGLPEKPTLRQFIKKFDKYSALVDEVRHHAAPQTEYLGHHVGYYDRIFNNATVREFESFMGDLSGSPVTLPWEQKSSPEGSLVPSRNDIRWIREHYGDDYEVFGDFFENNGSAYASLSLGERIGRKLL